MTDLKIDDHVSIANSPLEGVVEGFSSTKDAEDQVGVRLLGEDEHGARRQRVWVNRSVVTLVATPADETA